MTGFELVFRAENLNLGSFLLPIFPQREKCKKTITKFFHQLPKIEHQIKMQKLLNQALATMAMCVRSERIFSPYGKETRELRCFKD
jgi:hypothetical protein